MILYSLLKWGAAGLRPYNEMRALSGAATISTPAGTAVPCPYNTVLCPGAPCDHDEYLSAITAWMAPSKISASESGMCSRSQPWSQ
jgi:hypothetical protein